MAISTPSVAAGQEYFAFVETLLERFHMRLGLPLQLSFNGTRSSARPIVEVPNVYATRPSSVRCSLAAALDVGDAFNHTLHARPEHHFFQQRIQKVADHAECVVRNPA